MIIALLDDNDLIANVILAVVLKDFLLFVIKSTSSIICLVAASSHGSCCCVRVVSEYLGYCLVLSLRDGMIHTCHTRNKFIRAK